MHIVVAGAIFLLCVGYLAYRLFRAMFRAMSADPPVRAQTVLPPARQRQADDQFIDGPGVLLDTQRANVPKLDGKLYVEIRYTDAYGDVSRRVIRPDVWSSKYIDAYCFLRKESRQFSLSRVSAIYDVWSQSPISIKDFYIKCQIYAEPYATKSVVRGRPCNILYGSPECPEEIALAIAKLCVYLSRLDGRMTISEMNCFIFCTMDNFTNYDVPSHLQIHEFLKSIRVLKSDVNDIIKFLVSAEFINWSEFNILVQVLIVSSTRIKPECLDIYKELFCIGKIESDDNFIKRLENKKSFS